MNDMTVKVGKYYSRADYRLYPRYKEKSSLREILQVLLDLLKELKDDKAEDDS